MAKEICISSTPHETRLAIIENDELAEIYYERENEYTLAGSIYKGRVTRVLPGMQSAFVDVGLERDAFLYVTDFLEEQEDSADFERGGGGQAPRRESKPDGEGAQPRENRGREPREAREPRESRDNRPPRAAAQPDQLTEELSVATPSPSEGREDESDQGGTRRWRGRRGRRRGVRGQQQPQREGGAPSSPQQETTQEPAETFDIEAAPEVESYTPEPRRPYVPPTSAPAQAVFLPGESLSKYGMAPAVEPMIEIEAMPSNPIEPTRPPRLTPLSSLPR